MEMDVQGPPRDQTGHHHEFKIGKSESIQLRFLDFCEKFHSFFVAHRMSSQLILDPGFGFSKTPDENWRLLNWFHSADFKLALTHQDCFHHPLSLS